MREKGNGRGHFLWVVGEGLTDKITFVWSLDGSERMSHLTIQKMHGSCWKTEGAKALRWEHAWCIWGISRKPVRLEWNEEDKCWRCWAAILSIIFFHLLNSLNSLERHLKRALVLNVSSSKNLETVQVPFNEAVDEQTVVYFHSQLLCSHQNECQLYAIWRWILAI